MSFYIVCQKKRNNPRMDIRICEKKCELRDECEEFLSFSKMIHNNEVPLKVDADLQAEAVQMKAA